MAETILSITKEDLELRDKLFALDDVVHMTTTEFDRVWPLVSCVYSMRAKKNLHNGDVKMQAGECRLRKSRKSSGARGEGSNVRRRKTVSREAYLCPVMFRIDRDLRSGMVTMRRTNKDGLGHAHTIKESWEVKKPEVLREVCREEMKKGFASSQVLEVVRSEAPELLEQIGGIGLNKQFVANSARASSFVPKAFRESWDFLQAVKRLTTDVWQFTEFYVPEPNTQRQRWGLIFALPARLELLVKRGWFVQFSSTTKLNRYGLPVLSFLIRDEHGVWVPVAHCLLEVELAGNLAEVLRLLQEWTGGRWKPRYILTRNSNLIREAVATAFPAPAEGEEVVTHLYCTTDTVKLLERSLRTKATLPALRSLRKSMWAPTPAAAQANLTAALSAIPLTDAKTQDFLRTSAIAENLPRWAMYARQASCFLLQTPSLAASEAWNFQLTGKPGSSTQGWEQMVENILGAVAENAKVVEQAKENFRSPRVITAGVRYAHILSFPEPIQKLLCAELSAVDEMLEDGALIDPRITTTRETDPATPAVNPGITATPGNVANAPDAGTGTDGGDGNASTTPEQEGEQPIPIPEPRVLCHCQFGRKYLLPCRHIFYMDVENGGSILEDRVWKGYRALFKARGMEVYEKLGPYKRLQEEVAGIQATQTVQGGQGVQSGKGGQNVHGEVMRGVRREVEAAARTTRPEEVWREEQRRREFDTWEQVPRDVWGGPGAGVGGSVGDEERRRRRGMSLLFEQMDPSTAGVGRGYVPP